MEKKPLTELKAIREKNEDNVTRYYRHAGIIYRIRKTIVTPPFYTVHLCDAGTSTPTLKIEGEENWGNGYPWAKAERALMVKLNAAGIQRISGEVGDGVRLWIRKREPIGAS